MQVADAQLQNLKITKVRKGSDVACVFSNQLSHVLWLTVASRCFQIARLANFPTSFSFYSCVTMDGNLAFTVHATAHAFRAAINLNSCFDKRTDVKDIISSLMVWQTSCWNGFDVILKVIMMILVCEMFKLILTTFANF